MALPFLGKIGLGYEDVERFVKLRFLNTVIRPVRHVESADMVAATERQLDATVAKGYRELLGRMGLSSFYGTTRYGQMHYYDSAPGTTETPVVLLHGVGSSGQCFGLLGLMLLNKRRVVMPDLFHFCGFSQPNNAVMKQAEHVASVLELVDSLVPGKAFDFCGLSLGGWIGLSLAIAHPERVSSLALLNPAGLKVGHYELRDVLSYLSWSKFHALYPGVMRAFPYTGCPGMSPVFKRSLYRLLKADAVRDFIKEVGAGDFVDERLSQITCKTLLLWGREDRLLSSRIPERLAAGIPQIEAYWVERCAHILCLEAPANVYQSLNAFLGLEHRPDSSFARFVMRSNFTFPMQPIEGSAKPGVQAAKNF